MFQGLRTAIDPTPDLAQGKEWYRRVLERDPYFEESFYVGFSVGGFELGLIPDGEPGESTSPRYAVLDSCEVVCIPIRYEHVETVQTTPERTFALIDDLQQQMARWLPQCVPLEHVSSVPNAPGYRLRYECSF